MHPGDTTSPFAGCSGGRELNRIRRLKHVRARQAVTELKQMAAHAARPPIYSARLTHYLRTIIEQFMADS